MPPGQSVSVALRILEMARLPIQLAPPVPHLMWRQPAGTTIVPPIAQYPHAQPAPALRTPGVSPVAGNVVTSRVELTPHG